MLSNVDLWNYLRNKYPQFKSHTSEGTTQLFTEKGFESIARNDRTALNDFYSLSMQTILNLVNISQARDLFDVADVGENYATPYGGFLQRLAVNSIKPTTPLYKNLANGSSVDMFKIRKADVEERFFQQNFDYQSFVTIPADDLYKQIFASEYGMSEYLAGVYKGLENGYVLQKYLNKLECINALINSANHPLQDSQKFDVVLDETPTEDQLKNLWLTLQNIITAMEYAPQSGAFNAEGFKTTQETSRLRLLIRQGFVSALNVNVLASAFNPEKIGLSSEIKILQVPHFGGLQPFQDADFTTPLYPVYNDLGEEIGYNTQPNQTAITVTNENAFFKDPNENVIAVLMDKGAIFTATQNGYSVVPTPYNPAGMYTNVWANSANNTICGDPLYTFVTISKNIPIAGSVVLV